MEYINIHVRAIDSADFQAAHPVEQATWLKLLRYLCGQENGDCIAGSINWPDRVWVRTCNVTRREVRRACGLWRWEGDDLIVNFYPHKQEASTKALRAAGSVGGKIAQAKLKAKLGDNGTEAKVMEGNGSAPPEIPSLETVSAFCAGFRDLSRGVTKGIPEGWWRGWFSNMRTRARFPAAWQECLVDAFIGDFTNRHPKALGILNHKKNPAPVDGEMPRVPDGGAVDISKMLEP